MKKNLFILLIAATTSTCSVLEASVNEPTKITWTDGNGDWNDVEHWDESRLPAANDHVFILQGHVHIGAGGNAINGLKRESQFVNVGKV